MTRVGPRPVLVALAAAALVLAGLAWWRVDWRNTAASGAVELSGTQGTSGLAQGLVLAVGGALLLTLVLGPAGRRVVGVLAGLLFAAAAILGAVSPAPPRAVVDAALTATLADDWSVSQTWVPWAYAALGVAGAAASGWLVVSPGGRRTRTERARRGEVADSLASWKAMDEGHDPTEEERA